MERCCDPHEWDDVSFENLFVRTTAPLRREGLLKRFVDPLRRERGGCTLKVDPLEREMFLKLCEGWLEVEVRVTVGAFGNLRKSEYPCAEWEDPLKRDGEMSHGLRDLQTNFLLTM